MKLSNGFTHVVPTALFILFFTVALALINLSMKTIDMSIAYAVWSGVGIAGLSVVGILFLGEPVTPDRLYFIALIGIGVVGLHGFA